MEVKAMVIAVLGGDGREVECARLAQLEGAQVRVCGLPPDSDLAGKVTACGTVAEAVQGARVVICPIPLPHPEGSLFAPHSEFPLVLDRESLSGMDPAGLIVTGKSSAPMREGAVASGVKLIEYEQDEELMILRSPAIAEGAIRVAIEHTQVTLHDNPCLIVAFGKIGSALARALIGMGARVTVAARNPIQRARAWELGCRVVPLDGLADAARSAVVIFQIAPVRLLTRSILEELAPGTLLVDLAAPPGGVDFEAARELGLTAIWARGLGGRAPRTVGQIQWAGIKKIMEEYLG